MPSCEHQVGIVPGELLTARNWNSRLAAYIEQIEGPEGRETSDQMPAASEVQEFNFCPACGVRLDRVALGLMTFAESLAINYACSMLHVEDAISKDRTSRPGHTE